LDRRRGMEAVTVYIVESGAIWAIWAHLVLRSSG
jgi:hypothetical protein